ncbi:RHS repeat-associated core domain-containing protein [Candidatus Symbiothrix dinenymphae]|nr:RHS repeat-associated core domain-containing protein [Candidatus Symbiothrix dinenymphae]
MLLIVICVCGRAIGFAYNTHTLDGLLTSMRNAENSTLLWQADAINALGQITESTLGNGLKRVSDFDTYHLPNQILLKNGASVIDDVNYTFNAMTGNLTQRNDVTNSKDEAFGYDNLNRLTTITQSGVPKSVTYEANGNIKTKFDVGTYQYDEGNHAVSGITDMAADYSPPTMDITNTSYNRASSMTLQDSPAKKIEFQYGADNQRRISKYYENDVLKKKMYYVGNYEKEVIAGGTTKENDYIYTPEGLSAIAIKTNGSRTFYYVQTDHLGSVRVVADDSKGIQTRYYYDAWGKQTAIAGTSVINRGYLAQEHLDEFGLINLNARIYDPALGRFLEMDPYVQMPDFTQSYNRYAYGLNNPFKYTDPNGEFFWIIPNISWSKNGGISIGISVIVGIPGVASVQAGIGYSIKNNDVSAYAGATAMFNTVYASVSSSSGLSVGWSAGISPQMGFPISTNFTTVGANYNVTHDSWSGNVSAWGIDKKGWTFNPSVSAMFLEEQATNLARGQGFRSHDEVLSRFVANGNQQGALDYFGFKGKYDPTATSPGLFSTKRGILLNDIAFSKNYDYLRGIYEEELFHSKDYLTYKSKMPQGITDGHAYEEFRAQVHLYKNQGLYSDSGVDWGQRINQWGSAASVNPDIIFMYNFYRPWWHFVYKIPRRW